jgi:hydrogenase expression/formation protein HypE
MKTDKIFINSAGIGKIPEGVNISGKNAKHGDKIIVSGTIADLGVTILTQREGLHFESNLTSDTAPLNHLVEEMIGASDQIHVLRNPTRGGLATTLNEIAQQSSVGILFVENQIPVKSEVNGACELLGLDPLYIANEGKLIAFVAADHADKILKIIRKNKYGKDAQIIGAVTSEHPGKVLLKTSIGGTRIVDMLAGEQLPRIC